jgi:hypothetical protein
MILPSKHTKLSNSLINTGAVLLNRLDSDYTVTLLWDKTRSLSEIKTFERFILGLDLLFMLGLIEFRDGLIVRSAI